MGRRLIDDLSFQAWYSIEKGTRKENWTVNRAIFFHLLRDCKGKRYELKEIRLSPDQTALHTTSLLIPRTHIWGL